MTKMITIASGKGGAGKTSISLNLAKEMSLGRFGINALNFWAENRPESGNPQQCR